MADAKRDSNYVTTMMGVSLVDLKTPTDLVVDPATGRLLVNAVVSIDTTGLASDTNQTNGTQKTQIVDAGGDAVTVTGGKLDVNVTIPPVTIDPTGLATDAKQDTGNSSLATIAGKDFATQTTLAALNTKVTTVNTDDVTITSMPAVTVDTTGLATSAKQLADNHQVTVSNIASTPLIVGFATAANQLPDGHNVTVDNASIPVTGTFWQVTQPVSSTDLDIRNLTATDVVTTDVSGTVDNNNSSTTPLGISATFTGTATNILGYHHIDILVFSDKNSSSGGVQFQFSSDGTNWDDGQVETYTAGSAAPNAGQIWGIGARASYFRVVYTNTNSAQTSFRLQTLLKKGSQIASTCDLNETLGLSEHALVTKSVIAGKTTAGGGSYVDVKVNPSGALTADVTATDLDIRNLTNVDVVTAELSAVDNAVLDNISSGVTTSAARLNAIDAKLVSGTDIGDVTINNASGVAAVNIQDGGNSITVDGTVTANTGLSQPLTDTQLRATAVPVSGTVAVTNADLATLAGAVSATHMQADVLTLPANASVNVSQMNGVTVLMGTGNTGTGSQRVTIATDQVAVASKAAINTYADGWNVTLGAKADDKSTATDTTAVTMMQVMKQISASVQAPPSQAVTNAGTFAVQTTSAITGIGHGVKVVTTAGTDVVLAASTACKRVMIQSQTDNTSLIAVGGSGVDATIATGTGVVLQPGDVLEMEIDNLTDVYIDSLVSGEGVRFTYWT
jgi:hypothetical protein